MCVEYDAHGVPKGEKVDLPIENLDQSGFNFEGSYVIRPSNKAPVIWHDKEQNKNRLDLFSFGMVPSWTKNEDQAKKGRYRYANARDDKLLESRMWKPRFQSQRCLIPANGFYEPHHYPKKIQVPGGPKPTYKIPFYFKLKSRDYFCFAGLYDEWAHPNTGEVIKSFSIITTSPNEQMKKIHNGRPRQPVILGEDDYSFWLKPDARPEDYLDANIFLPWPDDDMEHWQVSKQLHYGGNGEEQIQPVDEPVDLDNPEGPQKSLF